MTQFGSIDWEASVRLHQINNSLTVLSGTQTVPFVGGYANFDDLTISHPGNGKSPHQITARFRCQCYPAVNCISKICYWHHHLFYVKHKLAFKRIDKLSLVY